MAKINLLLFSPHELRRHIEIPRALRFVEERDVFLWRASVYDAVVSEVVNVLDEHVRLAERLALLDFISALLFALDFVAGESFAKNLY